jgi:hypothetical protein
MKNRFFTVLSIISLSLFILICFQNSALALNDPDTIRVTCLEDVPADTSVAIDIFVWHDEDLCGFSIPLTYYNPLNTDVECDSVVWAPDFLNISPIVYDVDIDSADNKLMLWWVYMGEQFPSGDNKLATIHFTTGSGWDPDIGVKIDSTYYGPVPKIELSDCAGPAPTPYEFFAGCLGDTTVVENLPPVITVPGTQEVTAGETVEFMVFATDDNTEDILTITLQGKGTLTTIPHPSPDTGFFQWVTADPDSEDSPYTDTFIVVDTWGVADTGYVQIIVNPFIHNPKITVPGPKTITGGDTLEFIVIATDPDPGDILTITKDGPGDLETIPHPTPDTGFYKWETTLDDTLNSPYTVTFYVDDGTGLKDTGEVIVTVYPFIPPLKEGDLNRDGIVDVVDIVFLVDYLFKDGPAPQPPALADINGDCYATVSDVVYLINYVFKSGPPPKMFTEPGDVDYDGYVNVPDIVYFIQYMVLYGPEPPNMKSADVDSNCVVDLVDIVYLVSFLFRGGPKPQCGCAGEEEALLAELSREIADVELKDPIYDSREKVIEIPIAASFNTPVAGVQFLVEYNQEKFEPLDPLLTERTNQLSIFFSHKFGSEIIGILHLEGEKLIEPGAGDLVILRFKPLTGDIDPSGIKVLEAIMADENAIDLEIRMEQNLGTPQVR